VRPQTRFEVSDRDLGVECGQRGHEGRCRVSLHDHEVRAVLRHHRVKPGHCASGDLRKRLAGLMYVQIDAGNDLEELIYLIEHRAMLAGHRHQRREVIRLHKGMHHRCHFHCFGPSAVNQHHPLSTVGKTIAIQRGAGP
jgi:hypothetical protein